jgi:hypothetical protein
MNAMPVNVACQRRVYGPPLPFERTARDSRAEIAESSAR